MSIVTLYTHLPPRLAHGPVGNLSEVIGSILPLSHFMPVSPRYLTTTSTFTHGHNSIKSPRIVRVRFGIQFEMTTIQVYGGICIVMEMGNGYGKDYAVKPFSSSTTAPTCKKYHLISVQLPSWSGVPPWARPSNAPLLSIQNPPAATVARFLVQLFKRSSYWTNGTIPDHDRGLWQQWCHFTWQQALSTTIPIADTVQRPSSHETSHHLPTFCHKIFYVQSHTDNIKEWSKCTIKERMNI